MSRKPSFNVDTSNVSNLLTGLSVRFSDTDPQPGGSPSPAGVPAPYTGREAEDLDARERADLATCEAAIDALRTAFWAAGKALQTIRDARLYRETHPNFEAYVSERWDMSRPQADRLIRAWPLAERLTPIGVNEAQVRELIPIADRHGEDAAVTVYETVANTDGVKVTAALLKGVVGAVADAEVFDPVKASEQIRAHLEGKAPAGASDPREAFTAEAERIRSMLTRTVRRPSFLTYARSHPDQARAIIAELRALLDDIEKAAGE